MATGLDTLGYYRVDTLLFEPTGFGKRSRTAQDHRSGRLHRRE